MFLEHVNMSVANLDRTIDFYSKLLGLKVAPKPADAAEATRRWRSMRGRHGVLHTGHSLVEVATGRRAEAAAGSGSDFLSESGAGFGGGGPGMPGGESETGVAAPRCVPGAMAATCDAYMR